MMSLNVERYELEESISPLTFVFYSNGPNGRIMKRIEYQPLDMIGDNYYNVAFGDWNEKEQRLEYMVVTNNGDRDKVLATIAFSVFFIMRYNPKAVIMAKGATPSRTRLYQIGLTKFLKLISIDYEVFGWIDNQWELFQSGKNYEAFFLKSKN